MQLLDVTITSCEERGQGIYAIAFHSEDLSRKIKPGQFLNIRTDASTVPLLRRPFSVSRVEGTSVEILFNIVGRGTALLAAKKPGDSINILGPLGKPFHVSSDFETGLIVAGGLGVAPFPLLTRELTSAGRKVLTFLGARSSGQVTRKHLLNVHVATDDGSEGFHGTVVDLLQEYWKKEAPQRVRIFGCGPTPMLKALSEFAQSTGTDCELSLEGDMGCGFGICQGCPVERTSGGKKYSLVCVDGPAFDCKDVILG